MKKKILKTITAILIAANAVIPCFAAEEDTAVIPETEEITGEEAASEDTEIEGEEDPYDSYVTQSEKDEINSVQLTFRCIMPEGFNLGVYAELKNANTGTSYQLLATSANEYISRMYVPEGYYEIQNIYVAGDTKNQYPMDIPEGFFVYSGDMYTLSSTLLNYDEVMEEANRRLGIAEEEETKEVAEEPKEKPVSPWRSVEHTGDGGGRISISGTCKIPIHMIIKITATGEIGEAEYQYSTDGGATWSEVGLVRRSATAIPIITTDTGADCGLFLNFEGYGKYLMTDEYRFSATYEYPISAAAGNSGLGEVHLTSTDIIYEEDYKVIVKIVSTGAPGEAVFRYSLNGGLSFSKDEVIPKDGIYEIPETYLMLTFWHPEADGKFPVGNSYEAEIKGDKSNRSYFPYIIILCVILIFALFILYYHYARMKDKNGDYVLMTYRRIETGRKRRG